MEDDIILFSAVPNSPPQLVPAAGGEPRPVPVEGVERGFRSFPRFLPDGRRYIYERLDALGPMGIFAASLDTTEVRQLVNTRGNGMDVNGRLLDLQGTALVSQPFDAATLQLRGTPATIAEGVGFNAITYQALYSASDDVVVYLGTTRGAQLAWFDRQGRALGVVTPPGDDSTLCLTENERGVVFEQADPAGGNVDSVGISDFVSRQTTRLTFDAAVDFYPVCGSSGTSGQPVVFSSLRTGPPSLFRLPTATPGSEKPVLVSYVAKIPTDWTNGGRTIVFSGSECQDELGHRHGLGRRR